MSVTVDYRGRIFDPINDDDARIQVANARARELVDNLILRVRKDQEFPVLRAQLVQLLTGCISYHIQAAATMGVAIAGGAVGITNRQALDQLNYIAQLCGEEQLVIEEVQERVDDPAPSVEGDDD